MPCSSPARTNAAYASFACCDAAAASFAHVRSTFVHAADQAVGESFRSGEGFVDPHSRLGEATAKPKEESQVPDDPCGDRRGMVETEADCGADVVVVLGDPIAPLLLARPPPKLWICSPRQCGQRLGVALLQLNM